jgi:hypothetical protein
VTEPDHRAAALGRQSAPDPSDCAGSRAFQ